jgi:hypothetical protein
VDRPLADIVSFDERARARKSAAARDDGSAPAGTAQTAHLAREAMFRRFDQLAEPGSEGGFGSIDDELAVLVYDSRTESEPLAGVRGIGGGPRQLTFQGPQLTIEVELDGPGRELTCQVVPPQPATLEVRHGGGSLDAGADEFGTFYVPGLPGGAVSLRCVPLSGASRPIATSWVTVADRPLA